MAGQKIELINVVVYDSLSGVPGITGPTGRFQKGGAGVTSRYFHRKAVLSTLDQLGVECKLQDHIRSLHMCIMHP
jgi:hypothetical protein